MLYQAKGITQKMNNEPFIKVYDDLIPAYLQDHLELITLGVKKVLPALVFTNQINRH